MSTPSDVQQGVSSSNVCMHCSLDFDFELPEQLVDAAHRRELIIFAGAGISTEVPAVFPETIYESAVDRLGLKEPGSFPEVMQQFEDRFSRTALVQMVKAKFDYIECFPLLRSHARKFHHELATMPYLQDIITTNWDTYFEDECLATPFVIGQDTALYDVDGRKVIKLHGSISNLASMVATEKDYEQRLDDLGKNVMGGLVRTLLSTNGCICGIFAPRLELPAIV